MLKYGYILDSQKNKKLIRTLVIVILIGLVFFWFVGSHSKNKTSAESKSGSNDLTILTNDEQNLDSIANKDTDGDGLKDWEETLWKTDINNKDTDGDKTNDGEEITLKRDPTKAAPNDKLEVATSSKTSEILVPKKKLTKTESLAVNFFNNYLDTQGKNIDPSVQKYLNKQIIDKVTEEKFSELTLKDLHIIEKNDADTLKKFGNEFGFIFVNDFEFLKENVFSLMEQSLNGDVASTEKLKSLPSQYDSLMHKMLELNVPSEVGQLQLDFLNDLYKSKQLIERMGLVKEDPIGAMTAVSEYRLLADFVVTNMTKFNLFFISKGISFEMKEYGYLFEAI